MTLRSNAIELARVWKGATLRTVNKAKAGGLIEGRRLARVVGLPGADRSTQKVARALASERVAVWHGNYYALELSTLLGLEPGGAVRAGIVHYNDESDVERLLAAVERVAS